MKAATLVLAFFATTAWAQHDQHAAHAADLKWANVPSLPKGAQIAVIEGPMNTSAPFTVRLKFPANYTIPPHTHPAVERVTVLSGVFHMGMGAKLERSAAEAVRPGDIMIMQPGTPHYAFTEGDVVVQLHGNGPWGITYLNASDDPRNQ
jgi:quercetin dioxygenase-like cupin family protein